MSSEAEKMHDLEARRIAPIATPTDLDGSATRDIAAAMNAILADALRLPEDEELLLAHERAALSRLRHVSRTQRVLDNDADYVEPADMLAKLRGDNRALAARLREAHGVCEQHRDVATAGLIETCIGEAERRTWFLSEAGRQRGGS